MSGGTRAFAPVHEVVVRRCIETESVGVQSREKVKADADKVFLPSGVCRIEGIRVNADRIPRTVFAEPLGVLESERVHVRRTPAPMGREVEHVTTPGDGIGFEFILFEHGDVVNRLIHTMTECSGLNRFDRGCHDFAIDYAVKKDV